MDEKSYQNILIYDVLCKILTGAKTLCFIFDKVDGVTRYYDDPKCLLLFSLEKHNAIYDRIRYFAGSKSGIT